jgi:hypothetical protein
VLGFSSRACDEKPKLRRSLRFNRVDLFFARSASCASFQALRRLRFFQGAPLRCASFQALRQAARRAFGREERILSSAYPALSARFAWLTSRTYGATICRPWRDWFCGGIGVSGHRVIGKTGNHKGHKGSRRARRNPAASLACQAVDERFLSRWREGRGRRREMVPVY